MSAEIRQLDAMREAAFGLGMGFAQAAEVEGDLGRRLQLFEAFNRSFASVRLAIALAMRVRREGRLPPPSALVESARPQLEPEVERPEALERPEPPERITYDERDRDREAERVSLPILLRTLARVADDAGTLTPGAAELPGLRELLDRLGAPSRPTSGPSTPGPSTSGQPPSPSASRSHSPSTPPSPGGALRARLSGGTAALTLSPRPPGGSGLPALSPGFRPGAPRSTGPPRR